MKNKKYNKSNTETDLSEEYQQESRKSQTEGRVKEGTKNFIPAIVMQKSDTEEN